MRRASGAAPTRGGLPAVPLRWRLAFLYSALAAAVLLLLGLVLYREIDTFLIENTAARLRAQAQATISRHSGGVLVSGTYFQAIEVRGAGSATDTLVPAQVAGPPIGVLTRPAVSDMASFIVAELTTRDTSALVIGTDGTVVAGGGRLVETPAPPPSAAPAPPTAGVQVSGDDVFRIQTRAVPAQPLQRAPLPATDTVRVQSVLDTGNTQTYVAELDGERQLVMLLPLRRAGDRAIVGVLQVATSLGPADALLARLRLLLMLGLGGALALCVAVGVPLTRAALRPLDRLVGTAERIAADDLSARSRLPHGNDEIGRQAGAFDRMLARLQAGFQAQRQFVADAAHELRTPLTAISGLIELLLMGADDEDRATRRRTLLTVDKDLARLTRLVNDLLALSRHDLAVPRRREPVDLAGLTQEIQHITAELAPDRTVLLERPPEPLVVAGDPDHLRQVLLNLAENARRYTPPGARITFRARRNGRTAEVAVIDTGPGVAAEDLPHIFERFYRGDRARARASGGAGLGLAIARAIAQAHGGALTAESVPGEGAVFTLRLPLAVDVEASAAAPATPVL
jgi:signal transduction histidine kinase